MGSSVWAGSRIKQSFIPARRVAQALPGQQGARSAPRVNRGVECMISPAPRSAEKSAPESRRVMNYRRCSRAQLVDRSGRIATSFWRLSALLTSSSGRRHDTHDNPVQAHEHGGRQETPRGRVAHRRLWSGHVLYNGTFRSRASTLGATMLPRVVDKRRRPTLGTRRRHLGVGPGRLDVEPRRLGLGPGRLGLGPGRLDLSPAVPANARPPPENKEGTGDSGPLDGPRTARG